MITQATKAPPLKYWYLWLAALLMVTAALCLPGMTSRPLLDDENGLSYVASMTSWKDALRPDSFGLLRPFKNLVFYFFKDLDPIPLKAWHAFNLTCFLAATASVFSLARRLLSSDRWALVVAGVWALTPTQASTAVWMSCFNISLAVVFITIFLLAHMRSIRSDRPFTPFALLGALFLFLAQISYETAVAGIGLVFICDQFQSAQPKLKKRFAHYGLYMLITLAFLALRSKAGASMQYRDANPGISPNIESWQLSVSAPWFMMKHLMMWLFPLGRTEFLGSYIWGKSASLAELAFAWFLMASVGLVGWFLRKKIPLVTFGIFWFFIAALPSSNLLPVFAGPIEDYYLVFPSIGLAIAVGAVAMEIAKRLQKPSGFRAGRERMIAALSLGILALWRAFYIPFLPLQAALWNRPVELFLQSAETRDYQYLDVAFAAQQLHEMGRNEEALVLVRQAEKIGDWFATVPMVKGYALAATGNRDKALSSLKLAVEMAPFRNATHQACRVYIGQLHLALGHDPKLVREALLPVLEHGQKEYRVLAILTLANLYLKQDNPSQAVATVDKGLAIYPAEPSLEERKAALAAEPKTASPPNPP